MRVGRAGLKEIRRRAKNEPVSRCKNTGAGRRARVSASLAENRMAGSGVKLTVVRNGQRLPFTCRANSSQFDMTPRLLKNDKSESLKN
jgi:hypothetical protein